MRLSFPGARRVRSAWARVGPLVGERRWYLAVLVSASVLTGVVEAGVLALIAQVAFTLARGDGAVGAVLGPFTVTGSPGVLLAAAAGLTVARIALQSTAAYLIARIGADVQARLRRELFDAYVQASWEVQAQEREGHLQELLSAHVVRSFQAVYMVAALTTALLTFAALVASAVTISPITSLLLAAAGAGLFAVLRPLGLLGRRFAGEVSRGELDLGERVSETVRTAEEVQVFGAAVPVSGRFARAVDRAWVPFFRSQLVGGLVSPAYQGLAILLLIGGLAFLSTLGAARLGTLGAVVLILVRSLAYGQQVQAAYTHLNELLPFATGVQETLARFREARPASGRRRLTRFEEFRLQSVSLAYSDGERVLREVSLRLPAGRAVGIIGVSGAGKSSLLQVLLRLRRPTEGRYLVNGFDAGEWRLEDWQRLVAAVPQDPKLIAGTIAENIRFFRPGIEDDAIVEAARATHVHDEIVERLGGYQAAVGQRANALSGGQRQRVCLARALAGAPELLILDEPTSALDPRSEQLILDTLKSLRGHLTIVVVAHRRALLEACDEVWEVHRNGRVTALPAVAAGGPPTR